MTARIILRDTPISGAAPLPSAIQPAELVINTADGRLYTKNAAGTVLWLNSTNATSSVAVTASYALVAQSVVGGVTTAQTASYVQFTNIDGSPVGLVSSSVQINTGSFIGRFSGSLTGSLLGSASFATTSSAATSITFIPATASFAQNALTANSATSSSFATVVPWTGITQTPVGLVSSSAQLNTFSGSHTGSYTGSYTGSLLGSASFAQNALTATTSISASFATTASAATSITFIPASASFAQNALTANSATSASFATTSSAATSITFIPASSSFASTAPWTGITGTPVGLVSSSLQLSTFSGSHTGSYTGSYTGSLLGTASFAQTALSANSATSASFATTASAATSITFIPSSASFAQNALTANSATSASFATTSSAATSITFIPVTASFATTSSAATSITFIPASSSFATTASAATSITFIPASSSFATTASFARSASFATTSSFATSASWAPGGGTSVSSSYATTALTASYFSGSAWAVGAGGSSQYIELVSASYAFTASYAPTSWTMITDIPTGIVSSSAQAATWTVASASWAPIPLRQQVTLAFGASITPDVSLGDFFIFTVNANTAHTINAPSNPVTGSEISIRQRRNSATIGTTTWNTIYKLGTWTQPANGNSRTITFTYDGTNWVETNRTPLDVPN